MQGSTDEHRQRCPQCGTTQPGTAAFCGQCGQELSRERRPSQPEPEEDDGWSTLVLVAVAIGVIVLLIPALVIGAAVIGAFVVDLGEPTHHPPTTTFDYAYDEATKTVEIQVMRGDSFAASHVTFEGEQFRSSGAAWFEKDSETNAGDIVSPGQTALVEPTGEGFYLELVWQPADGASSTVIFSLSASEIPQ